MSSSQLGPRERERNGCRTHTPAAVADMCAYKGQTCDGHKEAKWEPVKINDITTLSLPSWNFNIMSFLLPTGNSLLHIYPQWASSLITEEESSAGTLQSEKGVTDMRWAKSLYNLYGYSKCASSSPAPLLLRCSHKIEWDSSGAKRLVKPQRALITGWMK